MDPVKYIIHLIEQGEAPDKAREHARLRYGFSEEGIERCIRDARAAAWDLISKTDQVAWRVVARGAA